MLLIRYHSLLFMMTEYTIVWKDEMQVQGLLM